MKPTEHQEQVVVIEWWAHYSRLMGIDERLLFATMNGQILAGTAKNKFGALNYLRSEGLRSGIPDLMLAFPTKAFPGMFIELKRKGEKVKAGSEQEDVIMLLRNMGYNVVVAIGADEAMRAIKGYLEVAGRLRMPQIRAGKGVGAIPAEKMSHPTRKAARIA